MQNRTVADVIAQTCATRGVKRVFGVPGGGSSLDLIAAFTRQDISFQLCRTETGAVLMAAADAEVRNGFGVAITTQGPGTASAMNGLAHAALDRAPVLLISDGWTAARLTYDTHQVFDQRCMSSAVAKRHSRLESVDAQKELDDLIGVMLAPPWGPAHIELTADVAQRVVEAHRPQAVGASDVSIDQGLLPLAFVGDAAALLRNAERPVLILGVEARGQGVPARLLQMAEKLRCPVLTTYKAKGVMSDEAPWVVGHFTGGVAESECLDAADMVVLCGLDPVELIGKPWTYSAAVIDVALIRHPIHYLRPNAAVYGPLTASLDALYPACAPSEWEAKEVTALRTGMLARLAYPKITGGLSPQFLVEAAMRIAGPDRPAMTVDAGAHMFSAMAFWRAREPGTALISNGLATMGFALPAAIARALERPDQQTIAFTGDGGLMMCAGELATAAQAGVNLCIVVFNDAALSLIALKQRARGLDQAGVSWPQADFASVARGFGLQAYTVHTEDGYEHALQQALRISGPCLIDAHVDPSGYSAQAKVLRG